MLLLTLFLLLLLLLLLLMLLLLQQLFERFNIGIAASRVKAAARRLDEELLGEHRVEQAVHTGDRIAYRHCAERIAVITIAQRDKALLVGFTP